MVTVADTAFSIAVVRAEESELPASERLFEDSYAKLFSAAGGHALEATNRYLELPFFHDGVRLRTRFIDDFVRDGLAAGLVQVVLLGAGFDCRGLRMPEIAAHRATVYEIDFADQLDRKRDVLSAAGVVSPAWIVPVACDFSAPDFEDALLAALEGAGFQSGAGALFVWEGVIGYIDQRAIDRSLAFMARAGGQGSRLAFTFAHAAFDPETVLDHTRRAGFGSCGDLGFDELWRRYLPGTPHPAASVMRMGVAVV